MTALYTNIGAGGPWAADDDNVAMDGYLLPSGVAPGPTVDGIDRGRPSRRRHGGMVRGHDEHLVHLRNKHRGTI